MAQLLQSTRNYLKNSTRLGRRMSQYHDDESEVNIASDGHDLHSKGSDSLHAPPPQRSSTQNRLSGLFAGDSRRQTPVANGGPSAPGSESHRVHPAPVTSGTDILAHRRNSKGSDRSHHQQQQEQMLLLHHTSARSRKACRQDGSAHMEQEVPRGRSPALSVSNSISTAASSYDTRPSDYPTMRQYQSHVWRRNLLEESIMHSLKLGHAERNRSSSRHRSRSKRGSVRHRKAREQAMLNAALGQEVPLIPVVGPSALNLQTSQEDMAHGTGRTEEPYTHTHASIISREMPAPTTAATTTTTTHTITVPAEEYYVETLDHVSINNGPYHAHDNVSMGNITHSFATFTLELPETHVSNIMASSAVPDMFKVKQMMSPTTPSTSSTAAEVKVRGRRDSRTRNSILLSSGQSSRMLTGKKIKSTRAGSLSEQGGFSSDDCPESPVSPATSTWMNTVFSNLNEPLPNKPQMPVLEIAAPAV
ncbi:hypothetical protein BG004_003723 [Podila humilis]|nr:hypothetical protein BG004_003723 [Podila humilis]